MKPLAEATVPAQRRGAPGVPARIEVGAPSAEPKITVAIPLEADLDGDPAQDDEVRLRGADGKFDSTLKSSSPDVIRYGGNPLLVYQFRDVPPGEYDVSVRIGEVWSPVIRGMRVAADGIFHGSRKITGSLDDAHLGKPDAEDDGPPEPPEPPPLEDILDQDEEALK